MASRRLHDCFIKCLRIALVATSPPLEQIPLLVTHKPDVSAARRQSKIGVVDSQQKPMLGSRGEHPIRLETSARNEVVYEDSDIRILPTQHEWVCLSRHACCVDPSDQALRRRFFVPRCAVDLPREKESRHSSRLERRYSSVGWTKSYSIA